MPVDLIGPTCNSWSTVVGPEGSDSTADFVRSWCLGIAVLVSLVNHRTRVFSSAFVRI